MPRCVAERLDVGDEVPRRVRGEIGLRLTGVRTALAAATLVEQHDAVDRGVEDASLVGAGAATRSAVEEDHGLSVGIARDLVVDLLAVPDVEHAGVVGLDGSG